MKKKRKWYYHFLIAIINKYTSINDSLFIGHTHDSIKYKLRIGTIVKSVYKIELIEISNGKIIEIL